MARKDWLKLGPSLLVAAGIIAATLIAVWTAESGWLVLAGPLFLALAAVGADMWTSRLRGRAAGPSWAALLLGASFLLASWIVALRDPSLVKMLIPVVGAGGWVTLLGRPEGRCRAL